MAAYGLGCVKTKSDLVLMPGGGRIFAFFFTLSVATSLKIHGAGAILRVLTQSGHGSKKENAVQQGVVRLRERLLDSVGAAPYTGIVTFVALPEGGRALGRTGVGSDGALQARSGR
jgi:hypothetical protein